MVEEELQRTNDESPIEYSPNSEDLSGTIYNLFISTIQNDSNLTPQQRAEAIILLQTRLLSIYKRELVIQLLQLDPQAIRTNAENIARRLKQEEALNPTFKLMKLTQEILTSIEKIIEDLFMDSNDVITYYKRFIRPQVVPENH